MTSSAPPSQRDSSRTGGSIFMSSLAEIPELVGFFSYSREDDEDLAALSALRERIQTELRVQLGRTRAQFKLWQDTMAITHGTLWEDQIKSAIDQSVFFIPIITPTAVNSIHCKTEFELFLKRELELDRNDLIFPILYIRVPALEKEDQRRQNDVLKIIHARQYADWSRIRQLDVTSFDVGKKIEGFCQDIVEALQRPWVTPQERRRIEAEAQLRADEERRQQAAAAQLAEEERQLGPQSATAATREGETATAAPEFSTPAAAWSSLARLWGEQADRADGELILISKAPRGMWVSLEGPPRPFPVGPGTPGTRALALFVVIAIILLTLGGAIAALVRTPDKGPPKTENFHPPVAEHRAEG